MSDMEIEHNADTSHIVSGAHVCRFAPEYAESVRDEDCASCGENCPEGECPESQRTCGHHCNCSWVHDCCHWCGAEFGEEE